MDRSLTVGLVIPVSIPGARMATLTCRKRVGGRAFILRPVIGPKILERGVILKAETL